MKITCPYCGNMFEDSNAQCPHCLAPNDQHPDTTDGTPSTIDELRRWYSNRHLPPYEVTRFFIGENVREPRAFGIYRDGSKVIVYKNKDNGQRAVRYQGSDEGYAVSEIFSKLKEEILHQKQQNFNMQHDLPDSSVPQNQPTASMSNAGIPAAPKRKDPGCLTTLLIAFAIILLISILTNSCGGPGSNLSQGYYNYDGGTYYHTQQDDGWYSYSNGSWSPIQSMPDVFFDNGSDYFSGSGYNYSSSYNVPYYSDFSQSEYYEEDWTPSSSDWGSSSSSSSDWGSSSSSGSSWSSRDDDDDDWDWDWGGSDSWDSGSSDWSSDW